MSFVNDDVHRPATLNAEPMTDEEFSELCEGHPDLFFETNAEGELIVMAPSHFLTGVRNNWINTSLGAWAAADGSGTACDSSTGFVLPNGARRSPDASWILKSRLKNLAASKLEGFLHLCPDFVVELQSDSDRPKFVWNPLESWSGRNSVT
jgi:Uma2 family endonuclease